MSPARKFQPLFPPPVDRPRPPAQEPKPQPADDPIGRFMDADRLTAAQRERVRRVVAELKEEYPNETPAGLYKRARERGAPIPEPYCNHGVRRGNCVICDTLDGPRYYFTGGGTHLHSTPECRALALGQEKVRRRGGNPEPIEVIRYYSAAAGKDPCRTCLPFIDLRYGGRY